MKGERAEEMGFFWREAGRIYGPVPLVLLLVVTGPQRRI